MIKFEEEKKFKLSDLQGIAAFLFMAAVIFSPIYCFGHYKGAEAVRQEAVNLGYGAKVKGEFMFKSKRAIERSR